jgi:hypothetical protein
MMNEISSKMWGIFDETGIFLSLCRHGFTMLVVDMVRSGELYVLASCLSWNLTDCIQGKIPFGDCPGTAQNLWR